MNFGHSTRTYYDNSKCICYGPVQSCPMATVHACTLAIVHACTAAIVNASAMTIAHVCTSANVHACAVAIVDACTITIVHTCTATTVHHSTHMCSGYRTCMYYGHSMRMYYGQSTCMYYVHTTNIYCGLSTRIMSYQAHLRRNLGLKRGRLRQTRGLAGAGVRVSVPRPLPHSLAHWVAAGWLRFCKVKCLRNACVARRTWNPYENKPWPAPENKAQQTLKVLPDPAQEKIELHQRQP